MFLLVPVLVQFSLENGQVAILLIAKVRVRVSQSSLAFLEHRGRSALEEVLSSDSGVVVDDLPGSSIAGHSSLRCSFICAHLQANDIPAFGQLLL